MRILAGVIGVLLIVMGTIWFFQGINVLPGSFMSGHIKWAVYGGIADLAGVLLLIGFGTRRVILNTVAVILLLLGTIWFFQGINVLPGSFMSGQIKWAVYGGIADLVGIVLLFANRGGRVKSPA